MGSETKAHPQRWDNFGNRRSAMDRAGKYLTLPYLTDSVVCEFLAHHFGAFKAASIRWLKDCYGVLTNRTLLENLDSHFPNPRMYQIDEKKLLFNSEIDSKESIYVTHEQSMRIVQKWVSLRC